MTPTEFTPEEIAAAKDHFPDKKNARSETNMHWAAMRGAFLAGIAYARANCRYTKICKAKIPDPQ